MLLHRFCTWKQNTRPWNASMQLNCLALRKKQRAIMTQTDVRKLLIQNKKTHFWRPQAGNTFLCGFKHRGKQA